MVLARRARIPADRKRNALGREISTGRWRYRCAWPLACTVRELLPFAIWTDRPSTPLRTSSLARLCGFVRDAAERWTAGHEGEPTCALYAGFVGPPCIGCGSCANRGGFDSVLSFEQPSRD